MNSADQISQYPFRLQRRTRERVSTHLMKEPNDQPRLAINNSLEFLAAVPSIVGIVPSQSVIVIVFDGGSDMLMSMRIDTRAKLSSYEELCGVINEKAGSVILVMIDPDVDVVEDLTQRMAEMINVPIRAVFAMPQMKVGTPWVEVGTMQEGLMPDWTDTELAAMNTLEGKVLYTDMREITIMYSPTEPAVPATEFTDATELVLATIELATAVNDRETYDPAKVGGILIESEASRDRALNVIEIEPMDAHHVFANASKYLRGPARVEALTAAGIAAYLGGEGMLVANALQAAHDTAILIYPRYETALAEQVSVAYHQGVHPNIIRDLVIKGDIRDVRDSF